MRSTENAPPLLIDDIVERAFVDADAMRDGWTSAALEPAALRVEPDSSDAPRARAAHPRGRLGRPAPADRAGPPGARRVSTAPAWLLAHDELGPLLPAAVRFVSHEGGSALARGAAALAWLSRRIDVFANRDVSAREEAEFVEGAGALLAAVLVDHVGLGSHVERDGVHRLRLGTHGSGFLGRR